MNGVRGILLSFFINTINYILPKLERKVVFIGYPEYDDMLRGLILQSNVLCKDLYILVKNQSIGKPNWLSNRCYIVNKNSIAGIYHLVTSRRIYFTHGILNGFKPLIQEKQLVINLWHGMPLKKIGYMDNKSNFPQFHYTLATSPFFSEIIQEAFGVSADKVIISDLPRNTILKSKIFSQVLEDISRNGRRIVVWLPTYRTSKVGDIRSDSSCTSLLGIEGIDLLKLNIELNNQGVELFIKPHPMAKFNENEMDTMSNIRIINERWLTDSDLTLYQLLSYSSALITDYSSVFIDYLSLERPIVFVMSDVKEYESRRGFSFDLNLEGVPGKVISNSVDFEVQLTNAINEPSNYRKCSKKYYSSSVLSDLIKIK
ncbi:CDP-glycerol glycerophosphotransferase family protein [Vibrio diazotrophicus]|uniref:CDP-glycerol glycerophosphotransferase family protein n=1 Tax=Vibrio diazotrophicus TaxID=685 RepID=UPI000C9EA928|nr:CDP-glycerol glycerophosphotransferase family protein [Vibrio diazotrophicus]PNH94612.1 hypothetical protein C1M59_00810 [Vibrio diazotrophicus]